MARKNIIIIVLTTLAVTLIAVGMTVRMRNQAEVERLTWCTEATRTVNDWLATDAPGLSDEDFDRWERECDVL